ncbi:Gti1/Pac2 family-domain-containing protein [Cytidiella melzeri]|nr:Gti1/Pac2 family-domain-containing protein [Cytidiella melzeri]
MIHSPPMQRPTCVNTRVRNVHDAQVILHAVALKKLPIVRRRLDDDERLALRPGNIYVWEERSTNPLDSSSNTLESIQRFTDGRSWGPSKARDDFLLYYEKEGTSRASIMQRSQGLEPLRLVKQTYSAYVDGPKHSRKWHLNAYYSQDTFDDMQTIDDYKELREVIVPPGRYTCARLNNVKRARASRHSSDEADGLDPATPTFHSSSTCGTHRHSPPSPNAGEIQLTPPPTHYRPYPSAGHRQLAPLQYLQNLTPMVRNAVDDEQLRALRHSNSAL